MAGPSQKRQKLGPDGGKKKQNDPQRQVRDSGDELTRRTSPSEPASDYANVIGKSGSKRSVVDALGPEAGLQPLVFSLDAIVALHDENKPLADALARTSNCPQHLASSSFYKSLATSKSVSSVPYQGRTPEENAAIAELSAYNKVISAASLEFAIIQKAHNRLTAEYNARHTTLVKIRDQLRTRVRTINEEMQQLDSNTASPNLSGEQFHKDTNVQSSSPALAASEPRSTTGKGDIPDQNSKIRQTLIEAGILPANLNSSDQPQPQNGTSQTSGKSDVEPHHPKSKMQQTVNAGVPRPIDADAQIHHRDITKPSSSKKKKKKKAKLTNVDTPNVAQGHETSSSDDSAN